MCRVRGTEKAVATSERRAARPVKWQRVKREEGYLVRGWILLSLEETMKTTDTGGTGRSLKSRSGGMQAKLLR